MWTANLLFGRRDHRVICHLRAHWPSGKLFKPMADTVAIALVGALILTLTLVPVLCALWFKKACTRERTSLSSGSSGITRCGWTGAWNGRERHWFCRGNFSGLPAADSVYRGEFMPHLDEGAMWIRATMPYTVSFETASKFSPQVRDILMRYPMVTDVGSELGGPTTAPIRQGSLMTSSM